MPDCAFLPIIGKRLFTEHTVLHIPFNWHPVCYIHLKNQQLYFDRYIFSIVYYNNNQPMGAGPNILAYDQWSTQYMVSNIDY